MGLAAACWTNSVWRAAPFVQLHDPGGLGIRFEWMSLQLDTPNLATEHDDGPRMAALACHRELEAVHPPNPSPTTAVTLQTDAPKRHVAVQQFDIHFLAMPLRGCQCPFADAVGMPEPGGDRKEQQKEGEITKGQHRESSI